MSSHSPSPGPGGPRKSHCCRTCGMPMKGHQRGACVPNGFMHSPSSSPLMPPPDTFPSGSSHPNPRFSSPNARPIMPGAYAGERPSEISVPAGLSGPLPTRSLRDRIGAKIEEEETSFAIPHYSEEIYGPHYGKHASAPVHGYAGRMFGGSASGYAASASGSMYGSSSTVLMPEHSVSQRFIRRDRAVSEGTNPLSGRLADRLGGYTSDDFIGPDNDFFDDEGSFECDDSFDNDDESDPAYPSDGSAMGGGASASYYASESEAGTYTTTGHSSAPSFGALMRGSGAAPLYTVYEVASKYVHVLRNRARRKGYAVRIIQTDKEDEVDDFGRRKRSSREPGNVRILLGRDEDALKEVERQHLSGAAMHMPVKQLRIRGRPSGSDILQRHSSPHVPPPPHQGSPYPPPQPGLLYAPAPATVPHAPHQQPSWLGSLCLTVTATVVAIIVLLFAVLGFWAVFSRSSE